MYKKISFPLALLASCFSVPSYAQESNDILNLSLKDLANIEVTSVSKKSEKASEAAAAIFVITQEDIRRSGVTTIPEVLRLVPGLDVARASSHDWAISSRGFNGQFANKLLVLIDGRTVYTPVFSGVLWDVQDTMLEDIDRIEVIRGPGATQWGANAVNGVINIITKHSKDTQGKLLTAGYGNQEKGFTAGRYGGRVNNDLTWRAYGKYFNRDEERTLADAGANDSWRAKRGGFRMDLEKESKDSITLQGDAYQGENDFSFNFPSFSPPFTSFVRDHEKVLGGNVLGRWNRKFSESSNITLQAYVDHVIQDNAALNQTIDTYDVDFQHSITLNKRNDVVWGGSYRRISDKLVGQFFSDFKPQERDTNLYSAFVQDKITLLPETVFLTLGSKFEKNDFTGFEFQPSARFSWLPSNNQTVWASVSRALRTPNRSMDDLALAFAVIPPRAGRPAAAAGLAGSHSADAEELVAYELGYRIQPKDNLSIDLSGYYNDYSKLVSSDPQSPFVRTFPGLAPFLYIPVVAGNRNEGKVYGFEATVNYEWNSALSFAGSYSLLKTDLDVVDASLVSNIGNSPEQQFNLRSHWRIADRLEMDNALYYNDSLTGLKIGDYFRFDTRLAWTPLDGLELALIGQNLLDGQHPEFSGSIYNNREQIGRSVYGKVTWKF